MKTFKIATIALIVGGALGFGANHFLAGSTHDMSAMGGEPAASSKDPLYWVAQWIRTTNATSRVSPQWAWI